MRKQWRKILAILLSPTPKTDKLIWKGAITGAHNARNGYHSIYTTEQQHYASQASSSFYPPRSLTMETNLGVTLFLPRYQISWGSSAKMLSLLVKTCTKRKMVTWELAAGVVRQLFRARKPEPSSTVDSAHPIEANYRKGNPRLSGTRLGEMRARAHLLGLLGGFHRRANESTGARRRRLVAWR